MKVKDLIEKKDYDYISYRLRLPSHGDIFIGCCKSKNGILISLDGDTCYDKEDEVVDYEEWSKDHIRNGLTVVVAGEDV